MEDYADVSTRKDYWYFWKNNPASPFFKFATKMRSASSASCNPESIPCSDDSRDIHARLFINHLPTKFWE
jgi:hypothetical protein